MAQTLAYHANAHTYGQPVSTAMRNTSQHTIPRSPSTDSLKAEGASFHEWLKTWTDEDVSQWLAENRAAAHAPAFKLHDIRGDILLDLDQNALKEMGIGSVGDRIKIIVAIKKLRGACVANPMRRQSQLSGNPSSRLAGSTSTLRNQSSSSLLRQSDPRNNENSRQTEAMVTSLPKRSGSIRGQHRIPPPLHLHDSATHSHPKLQQSSQARSNLLNGQPTGGSVNSAGSSGSASLLSAPPATFQQGDSRGPVSPVPGHFRRGSSPRQIASGLPPAAPAPKGSLPAPPLSSDGPARERERRRTSSTDHTRTPSIGQNVTLANGTRSTKYSAWPPPQSQPTNTHRKTGSLVHAGLSQPSQNINNARPSTANAAGYGPHQPLSHHPYATNVSPTLESFGRPSTAKSSLGPISEASPNSPALAFRTEGYSVGKGGFGRPVTPASGSQAHVPLEDLLRRTVKFIADDGISKLVNVENARDASDIMFRVLKKFGKLQGNAIQQRPRDYDGDCYAEMEGWGIFATASDGSARAITENELVAICQGINRPERQRGLSVKRLHLSADEIRNSKRPRNKLRDFFGEDLPSSDTRGTSGLVSPTSPTHMPNHTEGRVPATVIEPASPPPSTPSSGSGDERPTRRPLTAKQKQMNRASTVSVMSGLLDWTTNQTPSPARGKASPVLPKGRLRSFFGHRPPSELIQGHLADYFPSAEKRLLNKTVRNSFRRSIAPKSLSDQVSNGGWDVERPKSSRFSISSAGSAATSQGEYPPSLPSKEHYAPVPLNDSRRSSSELRIRQSIIEEDDTAQEVPLSAEEDAGNVRPRSRLSLASSRYGSHLSTQSIMRGKDSDTASLLTLDEITAEVETRRMSMASSWTVPKEQDDGQSLPGQLEEPLWSDKSRSSDSDLEESDEDDESEEEEESDEEDSGPAKMTSTGAKNQIKWIKGALIGAGSFGEVFLAMNAMNGTLMAVKQVEIPTDDSHNASRKKSMLEALEREIELLKGFQHPHIVEYLDSSSDGSHLNIFLEYVPGGSVAALLKNYGAFEEPLVKNFVRQIVQGLAYLHGKDIIHRDIKGANILVDNKGIVKISDFGISKRVEDNLLSSVKVHRPSLQGSVFWMAPEVVKQTAYTSKADIWSLGCVTVEMLTGDHPYVKLNQMQALFKIGSASASPELPNDITLDAQRFLESTFALDYKARPSASDLLSSAFLGIELATQQTPTAATFPR